MSKASGFLQSIKALIYSDLGHLLGGGAIELHVPARDQGISGIEPHGQVRQFIIYFRLGHH